MKQLSVLNIYDVQHLCKHLHTYPQELKRICKNPEKYYWQREKVVKGKKRPLATPQGRLHEILDKLHPLLQRVNLPDNFHAGRRGRSNITNALPHIRKPTVLKFDIKDFFPRVSSGRVYKLFNTRLGCSPDVAYYLTKLTTLNGCLPQGSPTSTIVASLVAESLAKRLEQLAKKNGAIYTQYVDDITLSGSVCIKGLIPVIEKIIRQEGFQAKPAKTETMSANEEQVVTGVKVNQGKDAPKEKIREGRSCVEEIAEQKKRGLTLSEKELASIRGKINYIKQLNRGAGKTLSKRLNLAIN